MSSKNGYDADFLKRVALEHQGDKAFQRLVRIKLLLHMGHSPGSSTELVRMGVENDEDREKAESEISRRLEAMRKESREGDRHGD